MAAGNSQLSVLLLGRTGAGKSTTGNKLIGADEGERIKQEWPQAGRYTGPEEAEGPELPRFLTSSDQTANSVTTSCMLLSSARKSCEVRVLDTVGFADTKSKDVHRGNLLVARQIMGVSGDLDIAFDKVLYFLPTRGRPEKADATMQDEIEVLWHFFGEEIFKKMALVTTLDKNYPSDIVKRLEPREDDVRSVFAPALELALDQQDGVKIPCPPVIFIPFQIDSAELLDKVKRITVQRSEAFTPQFRAGVCAKCAAGLYWRNSTLVDVQIGNEKYEPKDTKCHPLYLPKHSKLTRFFGGIAHILVFGIAAIHERRTGNEVWPGFFSDEEVCIKCRLPPGSEGCVKVMEKHGDLVVQHDNKLNKVKTETIVSTQDYKHIE